MPEENNAAKWPSIIPEIYYDVISRVPAGTILVLAILWTGGCFLPGGFLEPQRAQNIQWVLLIILLTAGYPVGMLLTPVGHAVYSLYRNALWNNFTKENQETMEEAKEFYLKDGTVREQKGEGQASKEQERKKKRATELLDQRMQEFLTAQDPRATFILPKMRAEAALCNNLAAASFLYLLFPGVLYLWPSLQGEHPPGLLREFVFGLVFGVSSCLAGWHRGSRLIKRQFSFHWMVMNPNLRSNKIHSEVSHGISQARNPSLRTRAS